MKYLWLLLLLGCSSVKEISTSNHIIQQNASLIIATNDIKIAHKHADIILAETEDIATAVSGVVDITPWWAVLLKYGLITISGILLVIVLWQTGLGTMLRVAIGWLPRKKVSEANLVMQALDESNPTTLREYIASKRSTDPMFNAAWKREVKNAGTKTN